ncbi:MAG: efflux RND transporter periplasmic adaptor subunit [Planctomycetes bacterium]|nr:efflux RND transporter periplasmic adaptor subunit [Planctomycetota bacterium]
MTRSSSLRRSALVLRWGACAGLVVLACGCRERERTAGEQAASVRFDVRVSAVERAPLQRHVRVTGSLYGEEQATIAAKVAGRVVGLYHDVGDVVMPGAELARIEATDYELAVAERRRALEQALARMGLEALPEADFSVDALPAVERARLQAENAAARHERGRVLHERVPPAVSDQDFADLRTAWEVAMADHELARLSARAQLAEARTLRAQLDSAEQRLADTLHRVPDGVRPSDRVESDGADAKAEYAITARHVAVGDFVNVGAALFEILDPDPLEARVRVPERELARIRVGLPARLRVEAYSEEFVGRVARVNPAVDVRTRTFEVEILVPNAQRRLRAGSFAKVAIESEIDDQALFVPKSAITTFAGVHKVFTVKDGKAAERVVALGESVGERIEITSGVSERDGVVVQPPAGLVSGAEVRIVVDGSAESVGSEVK